MKHQKKREISGNLGGRGVIPTRNSTEILEKKKKGKLRNSTPEISHIINNNNK